MEYIGPDRNDMGRAKAAEAQLIAAGAKPHDIRREYLLPNPPQEPELTLEQQAEQFDRMAKVHNKQWQQSQLEPLPPSSS